MASKEIRKLIKELERQGFDVEPTKNGHYTVRKDGQRITTLPGTPSDSRSTKNSLAHLKRNGFQP